MSARMLARGVTVAMMGAAVVIATVDGFAQSYAGLYGWAIEHGLSGWKADSFPLMVDLFIGVGELGLFLLAIDGHRLRKSALSWLDLLTPAAVAASGWSASLVFNVGHTQHVFSYQATAAVPPLASMVGLLVLLRTLHRYVAQADAASAVAAPGALEAVPEGPEPVPDDDPVEDAPRAVGADGRHGRTRRTRTRSTRGTRRTAVPVAPDPHQVRAASVFAEQVRAGRVPGIRAIKTNLKVGQDRAQEVRAYLAMLAENRAVPTEAGSS
jgi:Protein of unknown function (DUF2637)